MPNGPAVQQPSEPSALVVRVGGVGHVPSPGEQFTFGRSTKCTLCLDETDMAISRHAGTIEYEAGSWWLANASSTRQFAVVDEVGFRSVLIPGRRVVVEGRLRVLVDGTNRGHELVLEAPEPAADVLLTVDDETSTAIGGEVMINNSDRAALVALFAGYLEEGPLYDPYPKSYAAAAARLGWPRTTLVKRIEYLRNRLDKAGVPNMQGWKALSNLAEYVLAAQIISREDLRIIRKR